MSQKFEPVAPPPYSEGYDTPPSYPREHHPEAGPPLGTRVYPPPPPTTPYPLPPLTGAYPLPPLTGAYPPSPHKATYPPLPPKAAYPPPPPQGGPQPERTVITVSTTPTVGTAGQPQALVLTVGDCPRCRIGYVRSEYSTCGIVLAILFFPVGILCCLCMMDRRCSNCGHQP